MARILTVEIEVNGRKKIVNADDPRAIAKPEPKAEIQAEKPKRGRPRKIEV